MLTTLFTIYPEVYTLFALCLIASGFAFIYASQLHRVIDYAIAVQRSFAEFVYLNADVSLRLFEPTNYSIRQTQLQCFRGYLSFNVFTMMGQDPIRLGYIEPHADAALSKPVIEAGIYHEPIVSEESPVITDVRQIILMRMNQYVYT